MTANADNRINGETFPKNSLQGQNDLVIGAILEVLNQPRFQKELTLAMLTDENATPKNCNALTSLDFIIEKVSNATWQPRFKEAIRDVIQDKIHNNSTVQQ